MTSLVYKAHSDWPSVCMRACNHSCDVTIFSVRALITQQGF